MNLLAALRPAAALALASLPLYAQSPAPPTSALKAVNSPALNDTLNPSLFNDLHWRLIGPFRAGRVVAVSGVPGSDGTFYFGGVDGGVWKTTDAGTVWKPVFDNQPVASIGAIAVAPSDPNVIYVGTGESDIRSDLASGNGMYRSDDAGKTWKHIGLDDALQISRVLVDPSDSKTVYVGALGHPYGPNPERGVFKSTDGGEHWQHILDKGPSVGIADLAMATAKPNTLFATTWNAHRAPWSTYPPVEGPGNGLYRSTDSGKTWQQIQGHGLPAGAWGRTGVAVSADGARVYATVEVKPTPEPAKATPGHATRPNARPVKPTPAPKTETGLYRSDDGGNSWQLVNTDPRLTSRGWYFNALAIDPNHPDTLYIPNVALYRTEDGGKTIQIVRGAPGGDDYHQLWVDPKNSNHLMLGVDQGATYSLDHGKTWTTWYNQPTAQMYHVTTDHKFPYTVYGAQQDSGGIAIHSRTDHGHIDTRDWFLPAGTESGYMALDPKDENILYYTGTYDTVGRMDLRTRLTQNIAPWPLGGFETPINKRRYRDSWTPVLAFSPADKQSLYLGTQYVMKTTDGGLHWEEISPDLTGAAANTKEDTPLTVANAEQRGYGTVYTIAPSPLQADTIWAGSDTGRIHLTTDGGRHWQDVTPPDLQPWSKISLIEASHFDPATAFAAVDRHRLGDRKPYIYITHNSGKTWKLSITGIAAPDFLRAVRQDPTDKNLLFAATEFGVYVSFNAGENWQKLQLNLPVTSVRDLEIHDNDLIAATHGRSFWILDNITPLRQAAEIHQAQAYLYKPAAAVRVDNDPFLGTPLPPEEPQAENPPSGAIIDYYLSQPISKITLQILDAQNHVLRHFSSAEKQPKSRPLLPIAERWFPKPQELEATAGEHRFIWNLTTGAGADSGDDDDEGAGPPPGPKVAPGNYTLRLTADGKTLESPLQITMDPRSQATPAVLKEQYTLAGTIYAQAVIARKTMAELQGVESRLTAMQGSQASAQLAGTLTTALSKLHTIERGAQANADEDADTGAGQPGLAAATQGLAVALRMVESGDRTPPSQALTIYHLMSEAAHQQVAAWQQYKASELPRLNKALKQANQKPLQVAAIEEQVHYAMTR